ncbi:amino acid kinase family protein [Vibrio hepatarius]|uniref:amino acid kinase family protein n=1 Tax=Vibrio hepatarius TaxID=171383 RepID=UPI001C09556D|nr:aspartate kinase [Vibrio hepatarius]MBU2899209.1 aspartate kinase [Vibrio hepatarius]
MSHTVEKVSGSSMADFDAVLDNIILKPEPKARYNRILVVPAYQGITDALLENNTTHEPGVYQYTLSGGCIWESKLDSVIQRLLLVNESLFADPMLRRKADDFILELVACTRQWIRDHLSMNHSEHNSSNYCFWNLIRERLASIGEAHSAYNTALKAKRYGVQTKFIDLAGSPNELRKSLDCQVWSNLGALDLSNELPIVTAYASCEMNNHCQNDRRYGDLTLSRIAALTDAKQAIIHKSHHVSSGDPALIGAEQVSPLGNSSYQVANQLSALSNEVVHPAAIEELSQKNIDLRVKCTFEPEHPGTFISCSHHPEKPKVEVISGKEDVCVLRVWLTDNNVDLDTLEYQLLALPSISLLHHDALDKVVSYYFDCSAHNWGEIFTKVKKLLPNNELNVQRVALLSVLGTKIDSEQTLSVGCSALEKHGIYPKNTHYYQDGSSVRFVVATAQFKAALCALHYAFLKH